MKNGERLSLEQVRAFLKASEEFRFEASKRKEVYDWVTRTLVEHEYHGQTREAKGVLRQYVGKMTGLSRAQVTRLIGRYQQSGMVKERGYRRNRFARRYTPADIEQLTALEPSAIDAAAENVRTRRRGEAETVSTAPFPAAVPAGGY